MHTNPTGRLAGTIINDELLEHLHATRQKLVNALTDVEAEHQQFDAETERLAEQPTPPSWKVLEKRQRAKFELFQRQQQTLADVATFAESVAVEHEGLIAELLNQNELEDAVAEALCSIGYTCECSRTNPAFWVDPTGKTHAAIHGVLRSHPTITDRRSRCVCPRETTHAG